MKGKCELEQTQKGMLDLLVYFDKSCRDLNIDYWIDGGSLLGLKRHGGFIPWDDDIDICVLYNDYVSLINHLENKCERHPYYSTFYNQNNFDYWCEYLGDCRILAHGLLPIRVDIIPVKSLPNNQDSLEYDRSLTNIANFFIKGKIKNESDILKEHRDKYLDINIKFDVRRAIFFKDFFNYLSQNSEKKEDNLFTYSFNDMLVDKTRRCYKYEEIFPTKKETFERLHVSSPNNIDSYLKVLYGDNYMAPPPQSAQIPYSDNYIYNTEFKKKTDKNIKIFLQRELVHYKARMQRFKLLRYFEKLKSFLSFSYSCIQNNSYKYWWMNLKYTLKKNARF